MTLSNAKARLDQGGGEPATGYISPSDIKTSYDDLKDEWLTNLSHSGALIVASSQAPAAITACADYVCDGTADEVQINAAIVAAAATPATVTNPASLGGYGRVVLTAGRYNIAASVAMETGVTLEGQGWLTELCAQGLGGTGVVTITDADVHATQLRDLWINGNGTTGNAHGIHYDASAGGSFSGRPDTDPDSYNVIQNVLVTDCDNASADRHGIWMEGSSGGSRASKLINCHSWLCDGYGIYMNGSSDCHLTDCTASTAGSGSTQHGFMIASGNTQLVGCKAYYCEGHGFYFSSSRVNAIGCVAQDNGYWGFYMASADGNIVGGQADSNGRLDNTATNGGGIYVTQSCVISGINVFDRNQTPASPQLIGIEIASALSKTLINGRVEVPSGSNHVVNSTNLSDSSNQINIVRSGTSPVQYPTAAGGGATTLTLGTGVSNGAPDDGTLIVRY